MKKIILYVSVFFLIILVVVGSLFFLKNKKAQEKKLEELSIQYNSLALNEEQKKTTEKELEKLSPEDVLKFRKINQKMLLAKEEIPQEKKQKALAAIEKADLIISKKIIARFGEKATFYNLSMEQRLELEKITKEDKEIRESMEEVDEALNN